MSKLTPTQRDAYNNYAHSPQETYAASVNFAKMLHGTKGISSGSRAIDAIVIPTRQSQVRVWNMPSGHGKSTQLRIVATTEAKRIVADEETDKHYVAFVGYEETVETGEIYLSGQGIDKSQYFRGNVKPEKVMRASVNRPSLPVWTFGTSLMKTNASVKPMTIEMVMAAIEAIHRLHDVTPTVIVIDYIQEIVVERPTSSRTADVIEAMNGVIHLAKQVGAAVELGSQAAKRVLDYAVPLPGPGDTEYSHFIHQKVTTHLGGWYPWATHRNVEEVKEEGIPLGDLRIPINPRLVLWQPNKGRHSQLEGAVAVDIDRENMELHDYPEMLRKYGVITDERTKQNHRQERQQPTREGTEQSQEDNGQAPALSAEPLPWD